MACLTVLISACDIEGEVQQGSINSTISPNSGAAGGNSPILGGVYYDSLDGLTISDSGDAGQVLVLNSILIPEWTNIEDSGALPSSGGNMSGNIGMNGNFISYDGINGGIYLDSSGNVAIGTTNALAKLHVVGDAYKTDGSPSWIVPSDFKLKKDIRPSEKGLEFINRLKIKNFSYKKNSLMGLAEGVETGLIAQEVETVFPEAVSYIGQYMMLDYHPIYMAQLKAVQELSDENKALKKRLKEIESKLDRLLN